VGLAKPLADGWEGLYWEPLHKYLTIRTAARHSYPTADIDTMLAEIYSRVPGQTSVILVDSNVPLGLTSAAKSLAATEFSARG
jgi:hypothetical protein